MANIVEIDEPHLARDGAEVLENGDLLLLSTLPFVVAADEADLLDPAIFSGGSKNVSYNPADGSLRGVALEGEALVMCRNMVARYADFAEGLAKRIAPSYARALQRRRTSFRPGEVAQRVLSPRKDDRLLHVDAFPANPTQGRRILRIFSNVNPAGRARHWRLGGQSFSEFAHQFAPRLKKGPNPIEAAALQALTITKGRRTPYDHAMLQLHDLGKADAQHQTMTPQQDAMLPALSTWAVYTDCVQHAAMAGQHLFEQTFLLPPNAMQNPEKSPLRILEGMMGRKLA